MENDDSDNTSPIEVNSLTKFIDVIEKERGYLVVASPLFDLEGEGFSDRGCAYSIDFVSRTSDNRPIEFKEEKKFRFGKERGYAEIDNDDYFSIKTILTAHYRLQAIKEKLPDINTKIIIEAGEITNMAIQMMEILATEYNITPFKNS